MIRFCDSNVGRIEYNLLDRNTLFSYFRMGNKNEIVCVYSDTKAENLIGIITYDSLMNALSIDSAIIKEYLILDQDIWQNARNIFKRRCYDNRGTIPLPVLDMDHQLICFAYQDKDANREIRMMRELKEAKGALQFVDVFPEYKCVKLHGFNELAYFFAEYLKDQRIPVQVYGNMWENFFPKEEVQVLEYECLHIYAEGTWERPRNWNENRLRSVSVEFECIDKIYEENIKKNYIKNNSGEGDQRLFERLRKEKEVILYGIDMKSQDAYDFLLANGVEVCCFVVNEICDGMQNLFGKKILSLTEAIDKYQNPVFIDSTSRYSAWGLGNVDYFDYIGYKRNERFIVLRDYLEVPENNLLNALRNTEVILTGDRFLCERLFEYLGGRGVNVKGYLCTLEGDIVPQKVLEVKADVVGTNAMCLVVEPICMSYVKHRFVGKREKEQRVEYLREKNIYNYTDYFCELVPFINIEKNNKIKYIDKCYRAKRIVLGSIMPHAGSEFFKSLLDSHPNVLYIWHDGWFNDWLFWICVRLSTECAENILSLFWEIMDGDEECFVDRTAFVDKMEQLLARKNRFTSQELFVIFHIAYMYMFRKDVSECDMKNMVIYWDPHYLPREKLEECVKWLGTEEVHCDIINMVRNAIQLNGSRLKRPSFIKTGVRDAYNVIATASRCSPEIKKYEQSDRTIIKFEDLKCNPREILEKICSKWDLPWSDTLMYTTQNGEQNIYYNRMENISGFDLRPVYNTYENFFSEFDRLRQMIIDAPWQKKYGYPYVEIEQFTRREMQEMLLKEFRFEKPGDTTGLYKNQLNLDDRIVLQDNLRRRAQETRCLLSIWDSETC